MRIFITIVFIILCSFPQAKAQQIGLKTNLLLGATVSPNIGLELSIGKRHSFSIEGSYNPIKFSDKNFWKHWLIQPEFRYWVCHRYAGAFWGIHGLIGHYNIDAPSLGLNYRYQGDLMGGGISYGYSFLLSKHWNLEAEIGAGYSYLKYDKFECGECGTELGTFKRNYFGVTKIALSLAYYF